MKEDEKDYLRDFKNKNLFELMCKMGYSPDQYRNFSSPFHKDKKHSFSVFQNDRGEKYWYWKDHSTGERGTIIELLQKLHPTWDLKDIIKYLYELDGTAIDYKVNSNQYTYKKKSENISENFLIKKITDLNNLALIDYICNTRKINKEIATKFVKEVYYSNDKNKHYFAIGFLNNIGGIELRNQYFKGNIFKKDITIIKGSDKENKTLSIFEGFISFVSALTHYKTLTPKNDILILNSVALYDRAIEYINQHNPKKIYDFLDNDFAGQECILKIKAGINQRDESRSEVGEQTEIINGFTIYKGYNDFNNYLTDKS